MDAVTSRMDATAPVSASLSQCEVETAIRLLTDGEKTALMKIAMLYAQKTPYDRKDLVQEAFARLLSGRRVWPREANAVVFLGGVIRSIAWEWKRERPSELPGTTDVAVSERNANAAIDATRIVALFDDDAIARKMVIAMMDGARGEELQSISGLGKTDYESKRTKIRRRIEKFLAAERKPARG
jgi:DNA-directed RNA polymerase specialized sigma24 family protein